MNPVEIGDAITDLAQQPFDAAEFPFQFLEAFGNKKTAIDRLRKGNTNQSDIPGAVLQRNHIHIATCQPGTIDDTLTALRNSPKTANQKARFILATDGDRFEAEDEAVERVRDRTIMTYQYDAEAARIVKRA
jgi:hypothetical protein